MNACDQLVLDFLAQHAGFTGTQLAHLQNWWLAVRADEERLAVFLHRQELLPDSTMRIMQQISEHPSNKPLELALIDRRELQYLRQRLPDVAVLDGDDAMPQTVALLAGEDTAKDEIAGGEFLEPPRVGGYLGKYLLTDWIGEGGTGNVFRALHPTLFIPVAVKVLRPASAEVAAERFERLQAEARLLARMNHPHIVRVFDFEQDRTHPFIVLEHVGGPSLAELIEQSGRIQPFRAVRLLRQLVSAFAAAHELGVVHRDIKPANILLTRDGQAKVADFGLAQSPSTDRAPASPRGGTVSYMAPELAGTSQPADERSDIYALGATIYHALAGTPPFVDDTPWKVLSKHARSPVPALRDKAPELPASLEKLILRMLAKDPQRRPSRFAELLNDPALVVNAPVGCVSV